MLWLLPRPQSQVCWSQPRSLIRPLKWTRNQHLLLAEGRSRLEPLVYGFPMGQPQT